MKNNKGFTLPEVLITLVVLATSMTILSNLQTKSIFRVLRGREKIDRVYLIKRRLYNLFLATPEQAPPKRKKERLENPEVTIISNSMDIGKKSSLKNLRDRLRIIWAEGTWKGHGRKNSMKMVSFVFKPEEKKKS